MKQLKWGKYAIRTFYEHFVKNQYLYLGLICIVLMIWSGKYVLDFFNGEGPSRIKYKVLFAPVIAAVCAFLYFRRHFLESEDSEEDTDEEYLARSLVEKEDSQDVIIDEQTAQQVFAEEELLNFEGSQLDEYDAEWQKILFLVRDGHYDEARERVARYKNEAGCHRKKAEELLGILNNNS